MPQQIDPDTPTLTVEQAAKRMRRTPTWVAQLLTAGRITGTKVGNRWQVDAASLDDYLANGRRKRGPKTKAPAKTAALDAPLDDSRSSLTETSHDLRYPLLLPRNVKFGNIRLVQQLPVLLELDDDGTYILSDDLFDRYGTGESPQSAYTNLMEDLSAYYDIIAETATEDYPAAQALFERLQKYIQPVK